MAWNRYNDYGGFPPYVSVAERRATAAKHATKLAKGGAKLAPVTLAGSKIAATFWGKAWCAHLESFSDYANRLPRGRTYVRNGAVIDLQISRGKITAQVMGSTLYRETIMIAPLAAKRWAAVKAECAGKIDSLVGLLQGRLSDAVMGIITDRERGLFPAPAEIKLECSCPDWADMCKHIAAVLYGVGARLDAQPELLFVLRGVDHLELISAAVDAPGLADGAGTEAGGLGAADLAEVFGIEIEGDGRRVAAAPEANLAKKMPAKAARAARRITGVGTSLAGTATAGAKGSPKAKRAKRATASKPALPAKAAPRGNAAPKDKTAPKGKTAPEGKPAPAGKPARLKKTR